MIKYDCFAYDSYRKTCPPLVQMRCEGCAFYKTVEQHKADRRKATARIKTLSKSTQAFIHGKYFAKWEKSRYEEVGMNEN